MKKFFVIACFALLYTNVFAQSDTTTADDQDKTLLLMKQVDSLRIMDSLRVEVMKKQLNELAQSETRKRRELEQQLARYSEEDSLRLAAMHAEVDSLKSIAVGHPVIAYKDTLFFFFTRIGALSARERADVINKRLKELYRVYMPALDSLILTDYGQSADIVYKDKSIISITEYDEMWFGKTKMQLAGEYRDLIATDIKFYKANTSLLKLLWQIGQAVLIVALQILLIRLVNISFRKKIDAFIEKEKHKRIQGIKIKDYNFLDADQQTNVLLGISKTVRLFINLLQLYLTLPLLFSIFPPTQRLAETLFGYVLTPLKKIGIELLNYFPNIFVIFIIIIITRYLLKFLRFLTAEIEKGELKIQGFYADWAKPTYNIIRFLTLAFMFIVIFPYLPGSDSPVFRGVSVFLGIVFSLGSSSVISNIVAGMVLVYMRPFKVGDRIKIGDLVGDVEEETPFVTRIRTVKNEYITIPNSNVLSSNVINYNIFKEEVDNKSQGAGRNPKKIKRGFILHTTVTIGYDVPWRKVHKILTEAAEALDDVSSPFVLQTSLDDFYVSYQLNAYTEKPNEQARIYSELHQSIQDRFNENGVEILSPHYRAQRDGSMVTIPQDYLPDNYQAPPFRIENINGLR